MKRNRVLAACAAVSLAVCLGAAATLPAYAQTAGGGANAEEAGGGFSANA